MCTRSVFVDYWEWFAGCAYDVTFTLWYIPLKMKSKKLNISLGMLTECHALGHEVMYGNRVRSSAVDILSLSVDGVQIHGQQWLGSLLQGMCTCRHQNRQSDYISSFNPHCRKRGKYEFFFLFLLLRYNWQAALCKFMVYSITTWLTYIAKTITIISLVNVPHCI